MGKTGTRSNQSHKTICGLKISMILLLIQKCSRAHEFKVGGSNGWTIPNNTNGLSYNQWAETNRFQIGDTLVFDYPANKDTLVQVTEEDYDNCRSATPIKLFTDGHTVFEFKQSGPYYFISGLKDNCFKNEKLVVVVMADRTKRSSISNGTIMAPSPSPGTIEHEPPPIWTVPSSAPSVDSNGPPASGSHSIVTTLIGYITIGAYIVSCIL